MCATPTPPTPTRGTLTAAQTAQLHAALLDPDAIVRLRAHAVLWWYQGLPASHIGERCSKTSTTIRSWVARFGTDGITGLRPAPTQTSTTRAATSPHDPAVTTAISAFNHLTAHALTTARRAQGMTRADLITKIGIGYSHYTLFALEMPDTPFPLPLLTLTCRALDLSIDEITDRAYAIAFGAAHPDDPTPETTP